MTRARPKYLPRWAWAAFLRIAEPRVQRLLALCTYLASGLGGLSVLTSPPRTIEGVIGTTLAVVWGGFLVLGGVLGASVVLRGVWWLERAAVIASATGIVIYGSIVAYLHVIESGSRGMQLAVIGIALLAFIKRWTEIRGPAYDPES